MKSKQQKGKPEVETDVGEVEVELDQDVPAAEKIPETSGEVEYEDSTKSDTGDKTSFRNKKHAPAMKAYEEEIAKLKDRLLRLQADFDNYRKRIARDHSEMVQRSNEDLIMSLLPVLDHFDHAAQAVDKIADESLAAYLQGFKLVRSELERVLENNGVKPIEAVGKDFDANLHDALTTVPATGGKSGMVVSEFRKGYTLHGRILRASQVIVSEVSDDGAAQGGTGDCVDASSGDFEG